MVIEAVKALSAQEITELCLRHTLYDWSAQSGLNPLPVSSAEGVHFQTADGRRFIDFNSQLMCVNAGHGDRRIIEAIKRQADQLPYISPFMAHEPRARLGAKLAELLPGDIDKFFFTLGGAESNENAIKMARAVTGRPKLAPPRSPATRPHEAVPLHQAVQALRRPDPIHRRSWSGDSEGFRAGAGHLPGRAARPR